ncbi:response regulator [Chitinophagaceae bacterium MMS25-I14]
MNAQKFHFIIIDDNFFDCRIAEKVIQNTNLSASIRTFQAASEAIDYIRDADYTEPENKTVLLVDIQMPIMDGFGFVSAFEQLPDEIRERYYVYFITSSINENDKNRSNGFRSVQKFLNKPLTTAIVNEICISHSL